jgi:hypothetical protein
VCVRGGIVVCALAIRRGDDAVEGALGVGVGAGGAVVDGGADAVALVAVGVCVLVGHGDDL